MRPLGHALVPHWIGMGLLLKSAGKTQVGALEDRHLAEFCHCKVTLFGGSSYCRSVGVLSRLAKARKSRRSHAEYQVGSRCARYTAPRNLHLNRRSSQWERLRRRSGKKLPVSSKSPPG